MKSSEAFEGPNSSLRKTFDEAVEPAFVGGFQEVSTIKAKESWEERFDEIFTREDGLLDVGKYDDESLKSFITALLASERADWLRSEIEMLEGMKLKDKKEYPKLFPREWADCCWEGEMNGYNQALTTIITRYKEELLELENQK